MTREHRQPKQAEVLEGKIFAVMAYVWGLCIVPLVFKKDNAFVLSHSKQGLVIFVSVVGVFVLSILFDWILRPGLFVLGIFSLLGMIESLRGRQMRLPLISDLADKITL
jgi:uncharacterized membrane protein